MIKKEKIKVLKEEEKVTYICDNCEKEVTGGTYSSALNNCMICGREVCRECRYGIDFYDSYLTDKSPSYSGDYPSDRICKPCWEKGISYREQIQRLRKLKEEEEKRLLEAWKNEFQI